MSHHDYLEILDGLLRPESRAEALEQLEVLAREDRTDGRAVAYLIPLLHAPEPEVRRKASWLMGKLAQNKTEAFWPLEEFNTLLHDDDPEARENGAWAIGELTGQRIGSLGSIEHLNRLLEDERPTVRGMAAWALGRMAERMGMGFGSSVEPLTALAEDRHESVRRSATYALERLRAMDMA